MGHIKSVGSGVGSFGSRVMQDLSQPLSAHPQPAQMQRPGMSLPGGFLGMQPQQSSFGSSSGSLGRGGSSANIGGVPDGNSGFPSTTAPPPSSGKGITPAKPIAIPNHHKLPAAEAFLSI
ncbi:hypothetical protein HKX48_007175 [Thoreauomyces humboldtii]|nr:hypothetical protein HKX48_007175 [Thoreauomyces humboldtii]